MMRLAIISSHPIQYYAPWFRQLASGSNLTIRVFYLWDFGVTQKIDVGFQKAMQWDIPLLSGYDYEFVPNTSSNPGTHHFWGLQNPLLTGCVKAFAPDVVLMMTYNHASLYRFLWRWNSTPILFRGDSHRLIPISGVKAALRRQVISLIYRRFAACLYVGKANAEYLRFHGVKQLFFAPHAIDNDRFIAQADAANLAAIAWKQELGIPPDHRVILFAGKFESKKRPIDLLDAFLAAQLPDVSLLMVGSGSLEADLRVRSANHPSVYFAPFQNQSLMPRTYAIADVVVLPSYGAWETWGLAINEAMCLARPVIISSHVGCAQDLVTPFENGLIFPAGDVSALTDCLREAFSDFDRLQAWGAASQARIAQYSYTQTTAGLQQAIAYLSGA